MFISQATFSTDEEAGKEILKNKADNAKTDFEGYEGLISVEVWKSESKSKVEYSIVSKWEDKKHFQNWVSRPSNVEGHKKMRQDNKPRPNIEKKLKKYELYD